MRRRRAHYESGLRDNVCLTLSHQHLSKLIETCMGAKLLDAVLGNVSTKLLFRLGPGHAERVSGWVGLPYEPKTCSGWRTMMSPLPSCERRSIFASSSPDIAGRAVHI
jgi:hypothetical protein